MAWILTTVLCIILIEFAIRLPFPRVISEISIVTRKAMHILGAKSISDHWKEKVILAYAGCLFTSTIKLAGFLIAVICLAFMLIFVFDYSGAKVGGFIISWGGVLYTIVVATIYFSIRKFFV
jgi:hypothetical protein